MQTLPDARSPWEVAADVIDPPHNPDRDLALACAADLSTFIRQAWPIVEPAAPFVDAWHIDCLSEHLEAVTAGELPRLIVNVPPRTMKSLSTAVFWPAWEWLSRAHIRWLTASYAQSLSIRDAAKCRRLLESEGGREDGTIFQRLGYRGVLRLLRPEPWDLLADQNAKLRYETTETGLRLATSVGAAATGEGGDRILIDDPLNARQARSDLERKAANAWWDETMSTRFNNAQAAAVIVMQRLHQDDLTGHLLEQGGWHHLCLPAEYEPSHPFVYPEHAQLPSGRDLPGDPRTEPGELLDPDRLGAERLAELRRALGSYGFAGQMQQRPSPEAGGMFKRGWWRYWHVGRGPDDDGGLPLEWMWDRVVASWDMRFSDHDKASKSYVVGQVWGTYRADRYLLAQIRGFLGFTESLKAVEALQAYRPASAILVEEKANGAAVIQTLRSQIPGVVPIRPEGGKDVRAAAVEPAVEAGNVHLPASDTIPCPGDYAPTTVADLIEELATFPNGTHDDQVDAMSQALTWIATRGSAGTGAVHRPAAVSRSPRGNPLRPRM